jgi:hypothetical protein
VRKPITPAPAATKPVSNVIKSVLPKPPSIHSLIEKVAYDPGNDPNFFRGPQPRPNVTNKIYLPQPQLPSLPGLNQVGPTISTHHSGCGGGGGGGCQRLQAGVRNCADTSDLRIRITVPQRL